MNKFDHIINKIVHILLGIALVVVMMAFAGLVILYTGGYIYQLILPLLWETL